MKTDQLAPGTVLGRYELLLPIASGGMATVWVARSRGSRGFSKMVAVKTILPNLSDDPTFEQMFLDEAAIASKIEHPNVAQIIDLGEQDEMLYLVMEWVDGESLSTLSKFARKNGTDIPIRVGLKVIAQACAGVHAAHELRDDDDKLLELVHRDVSPQNILLSSSGVVKLVDFGVAKALGRTGETSAGQLKGKVPFMAPEQAKGGKVDRRTDIFALGIILYRLATGTHPFLDDNDIKTMRNIISRPVMPPRVKVPSIPVELERTILRALQKDPDKRQATAAELGAEVEAVISSAYGNIALDEVATFVRATLGERDRKRRAAIRDAALKMDETGAPVTIVGSMAPDSVSDIMLTTTQTPSQILDDEPSHSSHPSHPSQPNSLRNMSAGAVTGTGKIRTGVHPPLPIVVPPPRPSVPNLSAAGRAESKDPEQKIMVAAASSAEPTKDTEASSDVVPIDHDDEENNEEVTRAYELPPSLKSDKPPIAALATPPLEPRPEPRREPLKSDPVLSSPTLAALTHQPTLASARPPRTGKTIAIIAAGVCGVGLTVLLIAKLAAPPADAAANNPPKKSSTLTAPAAAPSTSASAEQPVGNADDRIDVHDLPDSVDEKPTATASASAPPLTAGNGPRPTALHTPTTTTAPAPTTAPPPATATTPPPTAATTAPPTPKPSATAPKPPTTTSPNVPTVQDPGF